MSSENILISKAIILMMIFLAYRLNIMSKVDELRLKFPGVNMSTFTKLVMSTYVLLNNL